MRSTRHVCPGCLKDIDPTAAGQRLAGGLNTPKGCVCADLTYRAPTTVFLGKVTSEELGRLPADLLEQVQEGEEGADLVAWDWLMERGVPDSDVFRTRPEKEKLCRPTRKKS